MKIPERNEKCIGSESITMERKKRKVDENCKTAFFF